VSEWGLLSQEHYLQYLHYLLTLLELCFTLLFGTSGFLPEMQTVISEVSGAKADRHVRHGDFLHFGSFSLEVSRTPCPTLLHLPFPYPSPPTLPLTLLLLYTASLLPPCAFITNTSLLCKRWQQVQNHLKPSTWM